MYSDEGSPRLMPRSRMHSSIVRERGSALLDDTSGRAFFRRVCVSLFCTRVCVLDVCVLFVSRVCHGSCVVALHGRARAARHARCLLCACCQLQSLRQAARGKRSARQRQRSDPARLRPCHAACGCGPMQPCSRTTMKYIVLARFVSHSYIHVTYGSKRSDGPRASASQGVRDYAAPAAMSH